MSADSQRSLATLLTKILEVEEDAAGVSRLAVGVSGNRLEFGEPDGVAIADSSGRRLTLEELTLALDYLGYLRNLAGLTPINIPKTLLGIATEDANRVKAIAALRGDDSIYSTDPGGEPSLTPKGNFISVDEVTPSAVFVTDALGNVTQELRDAFQNRNSTLDAIAALALSANKVLATNGSGAIVLNDAPPSRLIGEIKQFAFSVSINPYVDTEGWYWFIPDGTSLSNANSRYLNLYTTLWATTQYVVTGGRGASAAADWAAGKPLLVPDLRGRVLAMTGTGAGLTTRAMAATWGSETQTLSESQMPSHRHNLALTTVTATALASGSSGFGTIPLFSVAPNQGTAGGVAGNRSAGSDGLGSIYNAGSGAAFNISQPSFAATVMIWMGTK